MASRTPQLGLWLLGAAGNVATTVAVGLAALKRANSAPNGLITSAPPLDRLPLVPLSNIVLGGHEVGRQNIVETADLLHRRSGLFGSELLKRIRQELRADDRNIRAGTSVLVGPAIAKLATRPGAVSSGPARRIIDRIRRDLVAFADRNGLDRVVVLNVASTEPIFRGPALRWDWKRLEKSLDRDRAPPLPASALYAIAALEESIPYINFTPSLGCEVPAIQELAASRRVPIMGADGKTGETLLKSVLAPMFRGRQLKVLSWTGHNILGNGDGRVLASPLNKAAKLITKDSVLRSILGYEPQTRTAIEFVESLDDWKTAWDFVHFEGFLGTKMSLQFIWQGCDSILAAPLVIDLARLADYHFSRGGCGVMTHLACFFKAPMGVTTHGFAQQIDVLHQYVEAESRRRKSR